MTAFSDTQPSDITELLQQAGAGCTEAVETLCARLYEPLRRVARQQVGRWTGLAPLGATELLHESLLQLQWSALPGFSHRGQFMAYMGRVLRNVLVDEIRERRALMRGGEAEHTALNSLHADLLPATDTRAEDEALAVDDALQRLATLDPRLVRIVEMRYFMGLSTPEVAEALQVSERSVQREWLKARALLRQWMQA